MMTKTPRRTVLFSVFLSAALFGAVDLSAQSGKKAKNPATGSTEGLKQSVVLEVGAEKFTVQQMADAFKKNANRGGRTFYDLPRDSALQFLNLYADYRLKVRAAIDAGVDKRPEIVKDLADQRMQLIAAPPPSTGYLIERKLVDPAVERIFARRADEIKVAVIFTRMNVDDPADTMRAYRRAVDMLDRLKAGADFGQMAVDSTDDPTTRGRRGSLGYITGGMILRSMEDAAYSLEPGKIYRDVIRVPSGYVVLKVEERVPRVKVRAAQILFEAPVDASATIDSTAVRSRAELAMKRVRTTEDFATVAREMSDDRTSGEQGGDLISFYTRSLGFESRDGKLDPVFEDALFALKQGEVSPVIRTRFGYHIIKNLETRTPSFEEEKETIRKVYKQHFLNDDRQAFVRSVIEKQGFKLDESVFIQLLEAVNSRRTAADTGWTRGISDGLRSRNLFSFHGRTVKVGDWVDSVETRHELRVTPLTREGIMNSIDFLLEPEALVEESRNLETEYPEFGALMQEFHDGLLIIKLEEELVWSKVRYDEEQGKAYFEQNKKNYMSPPKLALTEILLYKEEEVKRVYKEAQSGAPFDSLAAVYTQRQGYRDRKGHWDLATAKNKDIVRKVLELKPNVKAGDILEPFQYQSGWSLVRVDTVQGPRPMEYAEAKNDVTGDYMDYMQDQLKAKWIAELRSRINVKIDESTLKKVLNAAGAQGFRSPDDSESRGAR